MFFYFSSNWSEDPELWKASRFQGHQLVKWEPDLKMKELPIRPTIGHADPLNVKVYTSVNGSLQVLTFWAWPCHHLVLNSGWLFGCSLLKCYCFRLRHLRPRSASWDLVQVEQNITSPELQGLDVISLAVIPVSHDDVRCPSPFQAASLVMGEIN